MIVRKKYKKIILFLSVIQMSLYLKTMLLLNYHFFKPSSSAKFLLVLLLENEFGSCNYPLFFRVHG